MMYEKSVYFRYARINIVSTAKLIIMKSKQHLEAVGLNIHLQIIKMFFGVYRSDSQLFIPSCVDIPVPRTDIARRSGYLVHIQLVSMDINRSFKLL